MKVISSPQSGQIGKASWGSCRFQPDGWSDITELYVGRYGVPPVGTVVFIRTCQHIDGSTDVPKVTSALVPAPTP